MNARAISALLVIPAAAMCGGPPQSAPPSPAPVLPIEVVRAPEPDTTLAGVVERAEFYLGEADAYLRQGSLGSAFAGYQRVLEQPRASEPGFPRQLLASALWGVAVTGLLGLEPEGNPAPTMAVLQILVTSYEGTVEAAQARWAVSMIKEIEKLRTQSVQKDEDIRRLNETMEQLRRIDLNRRPGGPDRESPPEL